MTAPLQRLIESLRNELQQYGEMLALLDDQHQCVLCQGPTDIHHSISAITDQRSLIESARRIRYEATQKLARDFEQTDDVTFIQLIPLMPGHVQPLVTALIQENNSLLHDIRRRAQRNHGQLMRTVEKMESFIAGISAKDLTVLLPEMPNGSRNPGGPDLLEAIA